METYRGGQGENARCETQEAVINLHGIANPYITPVNPNFIGSLKVSTGDVSIGDASVTGSIAADVLTVTAIASGSLAVNSALSSALILPATLITAQISGAAGGIGTYRVSRSQTVASGTITATGTGDRQPGYTTLAGLTMQVQALSGEALKHIDGLNQQGIYRTVHMNGQTQGVDRPATKGGDLLLIPTGLTATPPLADTWLVKEVLEPWDASGWSKVIVVLQKGT